MSQDQPDQAALATIQQEVTALANVTVEVSMAEIENRLGLLWDEADAANNEQAKQYISTVWDHAKEMAQHTASSNAIASSALKSALEMATKAASIQRAVLDFDISHPDVGSALESFSEMAHDEGYEAGYERGKEEEQEAASERLDEAMQDGYEAAYEEIVGGYNGEIYFAEPGSDVINVLQYEYQQGGDGTRQISAICSEDDAEALLMYLEGRRVGTITPRMAEVTARLIRKWAEIFAQEKAAAEGRQLAAFEARKAELQAKQQQAG